MPFTLFFRQLLCIGIAYGMLHVAYADEAQPAKHEESEEKSQPKTASQPTTQLEKEVDTLPEIKVNDRRAVTPPFHETQSNSTITSEELSRNQPSNIFEAVKSVPGVSINGGPRPSGMSFSIRGYADNEDVMVKVDGVPKGFEKYRMGGTFIEPELLKSIEVQRGPQITSGSGALGGTILATTKSAEDFLKPGQHYGGKVKFGYSNNNDEYARSYLVYARPEERVDLLYHYSNRQSNNLTLADGSKLDNSAIESISHLLKVSLLPTEDLQLVTSVVKFEDSGLQQYDANAATPGFFGTVIRSIDDLTWSEMLTYDPPHPWIHLKATLGGGHTDLQDLARPGMSDVINPLVRGCAGFVYTPNPSNTTICRGNATDTYRYRTRVAEVSNQTILAEKGFLTAALLTGYQYNASEREVTRFYDNPLSNPTGGFNASAPPGSKSFHAIYVQPTLEIGQFKITPGYRQDRYTVEADGGTLALLAPYGQASKIAFKQDTWSLGLAYDAFAKNAAQKLTFYSNYGQGFRPPLIDEYFTQGPFSRCRTQFMPTLAPASFICGALYQPQLSETTEAGVSYQHPQLLGAESFFSAKLNFFHIHTSQLLLSLREEAGKITQNGWERRNGVEVESLLQYHQWYMRGGYSRMRGEMDNGFSQTPMFTAPGNALNINLGVALHKQLDVNLTYRKVSDRNVLLSGDGTLSSPYRLGTQEGYEIWNAGIHWQATPAASLRVMGENLTNKAYRLDGSLGGLGIMAPGRNIKCIVEWQF